jgi:hypothetical protein
MRADRLGDFVDIERAISSHRHAVHCTQDDHPHKVSFLKTLGSAYGTRFNGLGIVTDLDRAI